MLEREILIGGEESGWCRHQPAPAGARWIAERAAGSANVMADEKKTWGQLVAALQSEFGESQYGRIDMHIDEELKQSAIARARALGAGDTMAGMKVLRVETMRRHQVLPGEPCLRGKGECGRDVALLRGIGD